MKKNLFFVYHNLMLLKNEIISIFPTCFPKFVSIPHKANNISFSTENFFSTSLNKFLFFLNNFFALFTLKIFALFAKHM